MERNKIQYFVNAEKGVVVAKLEGIRMDLYTSLKKRLMNLYQREPYLKCFFYLLPDYECSAFDKAQIPDVLTGRATCNFEAGDVFEEEVGKEFAKKRLLNKLYELRARVFGNIGNEFYDFVEYLQSRADKYVDIAEDLFVDAYVDATEIDKW